MFDIIVKREAATTEAVFYKNNALKKFTKLTGKHLFQSLFFNKVAVLWILWNFLWNTFLTEHLRMTASVKRHCEMVK